MLREFHISLRYHWEQSLAVSHPWFLDSFIHDAFEARDGPSLNLMYLLKKYVILIASIYCRKGISCLWLVHLIVGAQTNDAESSNPSTNRLLSSRKLGIRLTGYQLQNVKYVYKDLASLSMMGEIN